MDWFVLKNLSRKLSILPLRSWDCPVIFPTNPLNFYITVENHDFKCVNGNFSIAMLVYQRVILPFSPTFPMAPRLTWMQQSSLEADEVSQEAFCHSAGQVDQGSTRHAHTGQHISEITHLDSQIDSKLDPCSNIRLLF